MIGVYDYTVVLTYMSVVSACVGMFFSMNGDFKSAILCLLLSGLFDMVDGPVARTKKNRSDLGKKFGIQIDSLCDAVSFGVQPAVLMFFTVSYNVPEKSYLRIVGLAVAVCLTLCGIIRLAYFNVAEEERQKEEGGKLRKGYRGLPITASAVSVTAAYLTGYFLQGVAFAWAMIGITFITAILYIFDFYVPKPHGKDLVILGVIGAAIFVGVILL